MVKKNNFMESNKYLIITAIVAVVAIIVMLGGGNGKVATQPQTIVVQQPSADLGGQAVVTKGYGGELMPPVDGNLNAAGDVQEYEIDGRRIKKVYLTSIPEELQDLIGRGRIIEQQGISAIIELYEWHTHVGWVLIYRGPE